MPQTSATITFAHPDEARTLFGPHDSYLKRVRDVLGISIVFRGDTATLEGDHERVDQGISVFQQLQAEATRSGALSNDAVNRALQHVAGMPTSQGNTAQVSIDLFEKAKRVQPRTKGQQRYVDAIRQNDLVFCTGPAGCGKTYLAVAMAVNALRSESVRKIVLVRPAVEAGEKLGFLPGDMLAKVNPFLRPLLDAMNDMLDFEQVRRYIEADVVEIVPLAFMRGRTLNETFIILDEAQNTTVTQMMMFLTRMGEGSKIVVTGDQTQSDLPASVRSGFGDAIRRLGQIDGVGLVELTGQDIVRHRLVREIVAAYEADKQR